MTQLAQALDSVVYWKYTTQQIYVDFELWVGRCTEDNYPLYSLPQNILTSMLFVDERDCECVIPSGVQTTECLHYSYDAGRENAFATRSVEGIRRNSGRYTFKLVPELFRRIDAGDDLTLEEWCEAARMAYGREIEAGTEEGRLVLDCKGDIWPSVVICKLPMHLSRLPKNTLVRGPIAFRGVQPPFGFAVDRESL